MGEIHLEENKTYALAEVIDIVQKALESVKDNAQYCDLQFSPADIYWVVHNMLSYINKNVPGEFALRRKSKGTYRVHYSTETTQKTRGSQKRKKDIQKTADYLEDLTGNRPPWG